MWPSRRLARRLGIALRMGGMAGFLLLLAQVPARAATKPADSDHDGLSDALEQKLLVQFMPRFMMGRHDCSGLPAEFRADSVAPEAEAENGTIYGQAFPAKGAGQGSPTVELHYYHLWREDCGRHGHPLDTEHVAVLVRASGTDAGSDRWKALYWYAAAHENTVCDVSQIARASALHAEDHGATVWISPGKHASYLDKTLCARGCGADHCARMTALVPARMINLGEPDFPMNGSDFIRSNAWPLREKMETSNFPPAALDRLNGLPESDIAWFNPGRHPVQGIIATSSSTEQALATGGSGTTAAIGAARGATGGALSDAGDSTGTALSDASGDTGSALQKSYRHTRHALGISMRHAGEALHLTREQKKDQPEKPN